MKEPQNQQISDLTFHELSVEEAIAVLKPNLYPEERVMAMGPIGRPKGSYGLLIVLLALPASVIIAGLAVTSGDYLLFGFALVVAFFSIAMLVYDRLNMNRHSVYYALTNDRLLHIDKSSVQTVEFRKKIKKIDRRGERMFIHLESATDELVIIPILGLPEICGQYREWWHFERFGATEHGDFV